MEEFVDNSIKYIKSQGRMPDIIHSHYADAGFVCSELTKFFGIPFIHTGHSLGRSKLSKLLNDGGKIEAIEKRYKISHRIAVEENVIYFADKIITSTAQEIDIQYGEYENSDKNKFEVIPPGVDLDKFYPYNDKSQEHKEATNNQKILKNDLNSFLSDTKKPLITAISRADKRKNISGLIKAFGENSELQEKANLVIYAGSRDDISTMPDNEREVLTEVLLLIDKYNLYGKIAIPKRSVEQSEIPEIYRITAESGGIFCNVALTEPFGLTLIEAAGTGAPVVATNDGGPKDILKNLDNGILVDVSAPKYIAKALNKIFDKQELWKRYSENGIKKVKQYYTWEAHTDKYLNIISKILDKVRDKKYTFAPLGKTLFDMNKLIVSDIDNTLIGHTESLAELISLMKTMQPNVRFAVATGRTVESAFAVLKEHSVPFPDIIISSVGSEIYYHHNGDLIYSTGWDSHLSHRWNRKKIVDVLKEFDFLEYQEEDTQRKFKVSYYTTDNPENLKKVKDTIIKNKLKANIIFSHGQFLDILPYRASKGKAIRYLAYRWNIPYENVLVAGDSGNDTEMLKGELLAVVVSNFSEELEAIRGSKRVYFANRSYAGGIIDGIQFYDFLKIGKEEHFE